MYNGRMRRRKWTTTIQHLRYLLSVLNCNNNITVSFPHIERVVSIARFHVQRVRKVVEWVYKIQIYPVSLVVSQWFQAANTNLDFRSWVKILRFYIYIPLFALSNALMIQVYLYFVSSRDFPLDQVPTQKCTSSNIIPYTISCFICRLYQLLKNVMQQ